MNTSGIVQIHGKEYITVARRVELAHEAKVFDSLETEVLSHNPVVIRAKIVVKGKTFTGISSVNPDSPKIIEKQNPYEVAETSAVGRALGFAGFGIVEGIASADEVARTLVPASTTEEKEITCEVCGGPAKERKGVAKSGKSYHGIFCQENKNHTRWLLN